MATGKKNQKRILVLTGAAALAAVAINLLISSINGRNKNRKGNKKRGLLGSNARINMSASEIYKLKDQIIAKSEIVYDSIASVPLDTVSYSNVIAPLTELDAHQFPLVQSCILPKMVDVSEEVQKASCEVGRTLDSHLLKCRQREDVYRVIKAFIEKREWLGPEERHYVQCLVQDFERNGINLSHSKRKELESLRSEMDQLSSSYVKNLHEYNGFLMFTEQELAGMPPEFIKSLETNESGMLMVYLRGCYVYPILEHCKIRTTRKSVSVAYGRRCEKENLEILERLVVLRHELAHLLGYPNYADFVLACRMSKSSAKVFEFLEHLSISLTGVATRELNILKELKRKEEGDISFGMEDMLYYMKRAEEQLLDVDLSEVKEYFPVNMVISGIFRILQDLFGLKFEEIKDVDVWHETVRLYSVLDTTSDELLGYFYLDAFSREKKYTHTCVIPLQNGCLSSNNSRQVPIAVLISNCPNQMDGCPALLQFSDVVSLLHEFSHVVHHICNHATFSRFSGLHTEPDFVEIPGQLLENWCYEAISLKMISAFYKDTTKSISNEMCKSLKRRRDMLSGLRLKQEILFCLVDQIIHSNDNIDIVELVKHLHPKVMLGLPVLDGTSPASCFPVLLLVMKLLATATYGAFAADIFSSKFQDDPLNQYAGLQFRNKVLMQGNTKEPLEILSDYLGRELSIHSFVERKTANSFSVFP